MKLLITLSVLLSLQLQSTLLACRCLPLTQENIKERIIQADVVVEGEYIRNIGPDKKDDRNGCREGEGYTILFKVTKRYKGENISDTLAIYQTSNSCTRIFRKGEKYVLLAREIKGFQLIDNKGGRGEVTPLLDQNGKITLSLGDRPSLNFWNGIREQYTTVDVNLCSSFRSETEEGRLLEKQF